MRRLSAVLLAAAAVAGCKKSESPAVTQVAPSSSAQVQVAATPPPTALKGKILDRLDAPPYSYLQLQTDKETVWAAVPKTELGKGADATVYNAMPMNGFESKTLKRKFAVVYFGTLDAPAPAAPAPGAEGATPASMAMQHAKAAAGPADVGAVKVARATGPDARTVAELYAQGAALKEKTASVRGKVVKFNPGIMGKNWLHLRDGTGKAEGDTNDLTVTTQDVVVVGDVVTAKGIVRTDKDFGAGYAYKVILEDAKIAK